MKPTSKTPYEIRLELLQLAQQICHNIHISRSGGEKLMTSPTTEEIVQEAEKLNAFVSKANPNNQ